ncbi:hypothetical protein H6G76_09040 [Nostoc sp. FACHB-152]|uniref:hypothetical protein n=1 Tax=unclassified Nostoc TaxID=2593658 RepID=UPI001684E8A3|nr:MULTISPECIES: hypothetical protein [unclassified Nostoc]MBD2447310.1 hypothetical protein [Nostoc sp. FACHB-152]MBD2468089.1 hypothetical protein [Nostoc sp. FACHB-145]
MESPFLSILALLALVLLLAVTGGVGYLTVAEWRDRRLREAEKREQRRTPPKTSSKKR